MLLPLMRLPTPPSLEALEAQTPEIDPVPAGVVRPFWSIIIPTYNSGEFLRRTLESVLGQNQGPERMQIEVVDGCSTQDNPAEVTREVGQGRIDFHRLAENRGPAATFTACIRRARGHWVHILHGDDLAMPGFYTLYEQTMAAHPEARTIVGQSFIYDEHDRWTGLEGPKPPVGGGILSDFVTQVATRWLATFPSVVVNRAAYESIGGYCDYFQGACDWDMWLRLGLHSPVACVPRPVSAYRRHTESQSKRLAVTGENVRETCDVVGSNLARIDRAGRERPRDLMTWRIANANYADHHSRELGLRGNLEGQFHQARWAYVLQATTPRLSRLMVTWWQYKRGAASRPVVAA